MCIQLSLDPLFPIVERVHEDVLYLAGRQGASLARLVPQPPISRHPHEVAADRETPFGVFLEQHPHKESPLGDSISGPSRPSPAKSISQTPASPIAYELEEQRLMPLTMRPTGGHSSVYADRQDWTDPRRRPVCWQDLRGHVREHVHRPAMELVDHGSTSGRMPASPRAGRAPTLDQAKAEFQRNWIAWSKQAV